MKTEACDGSVKVRPDWRSLRLESGGTLWQVRTAKGSSERTMMTGGSGAEESASFISNTSAKNASAASTVQAQPALFTV